MTGLTFVARAANSALMTSAINRELQQIRIIRIDPVKDWIEKLFEKPELAKMGYAQTVADANLGLGWIYYQSAAGT